MCIHKILLKVYDFLTVNNYKQTFHVTFKGIRISMFLQKGFATFVLLHTRL